VKVSELRKLFIDKNLLTEVLSYVLGISRSDVFKLNEVDVKTAKRVKRIAKKVNRGVPLAYVSGGVWFYDLPIMVNRHVLCPRHDTEILVYEVLQRLRGGEQVLDLCTGSGCIAIAIAKNSDARVFATDISKKAVEVARKNAVMNEVVVSFDCGDLLDGQGVYDVIVSNPPYVRPPEIGAHDVGVFYEPRIAFDGGPDGLWFYRRIVADAHRHLRADGFLAMEIGYDQAEDVRNLLASHNWCNIEIIKDLASRDRVVIAKRGSE